jgi:bacterioferritin-associated ferredoxin
LKVVFKFKKMIVCICRRVSDRQIQHAIDDGARSVEEVGAACRAGTGCGSCHEAIADMIATRSDPGCERRHLPVLSPYLIERKAA